MVLTFKKFKPIEKKAQEKVDFSIKKKHIVFLANPARISKNIDLAVQAIER